MNITEPDKQFMREAIRLANESVERGGGPFGAVIVKDIPEKCTAVGSPAKPIKFF